MDLFSLPFPIGVFYIVICDVLPMKEAGAGIEPANRGFADPDLTTWLPRRFANRSVGARLGGVNGRVPLANVKR